MAKTVTATLDANSETIEIVVNEGEAASVAFVKTGTAITVAWTYTALGGSNDAPLLDSSGSQESYTDSGTLMLQAPGTYTGTASGVSGGGTMALDAVIWRSTVLPGSYRRISGN